MADWLSNETGCPELTLWRSALAVYLKDVLHWHKYKKPLDGDYDFFTASAYADYYGSQCQFTRLCDHAQLDAEYVRGKVNEYILGLK